MGDTLKKKRKEKGFTQVQLAVKSGVSLPTLQNIEVGKANPTLDILKKLCEHLDCSIELFSQEPDWTFLKRCGLPLEEQKTTTTITHIQPQDLQIQLQKAIEYLSQKKTVTDLRLFEVTAAMLWEIRYHYPTFYTYCLNNKKTNEYLKKYPLTGRIIKLMRMVSGPLSQII